jgi:uncharacterized YigZ family protein
MREEYRTLGERGRFEIERLSGSRFLATAAPVRSTDEIETVLAGIAKEFPAARHHCYAWRLGVAGERYRIHEDGEPGGSAGRPILERIDALELTDCLVVVTRWFGGTKLGVGGLVRAYSRAAEAVLARVPLRTVTLTRRFLVEHAYELSHAVSGFLHSSGLAPTSSVYEETVRLVLEVPLRQVADFQAQLRERTSGRVHIKELPPER